MSTQPRPWRKNVHWTDERHRNEGEAGHEARMRRRALIAEARERATTVKRDGRTYTLVRLPPESESATLTPEREAELILEDVFDD